MRTTRRHELQQNELDQELGKVIGFLRRYGTWIVGVLLLAALVSLLTVLLVRRARDAREQVVNDYARIQMSASMTTEEMVAIGMLPMSDEELLAALDELMRQDRVSWVAAQAGNDLGQVYAMRAMAAADDSQRQEAIDRAREYYQYVADAFSRHPLEVAKARLGLARLDENDGAWDRAQAQYEAIVADGSLQGQPVHAIAQDSLVQLEELRRDPLQFARTPGINFRDFGPLPDIGPGPDMDLLPDLLPDLIPALPEGEFEVDPEDLTEPRLEAPDEPVDAFIEPVDPVQPE